MHFPITAINTQDKRQGLSGRSGQIIELLFTQISPYFMYIYLFFRVGLVDQVSGSQSEEAIILQVPVKFNFTVELSFLLLLYVCEKEHLMYLCNDLPEKPCVFSHKKNESAE